MAKWGALHLAWLDGEGAPVGAAIEFARGDVGAPAVAIAGTKAVVVWAARAAKDAPYALAWTNARDPEVSGTVDAPVVVYGAFGKNRPGGVARLATLACR